MTGTAMTEEDEFKHIYALDVVEIPTNKPNIRNDYADCVYKTESAKFNAVIEQIAECHAKEQPVLVGTVSIEKSEVLSRLLSKRGIKHQVLNAKHHEKEAAIIAQEVKQGPSPSRPTWRDAVPTLCWAVTRSTWQRTRWQSSGTPTSS